MQISNLKDSRLRAKSLSMSQNIVKQNQSNSILLHKLNDLSHFVENLNQDNLDAKKVSLLSQTILQQYLEEKKTSLNKSTVQQKQTINAEANVPKISHQRWTSSSRNTQQIEQSSRQQPQKKQDEKIQKQNIESKMSTIYEHQKNTKQVFKSILLHDNKQENQYENKQENRQENKQENKQEHLSRQQSPQKAKNSILKSNNFDSKTAKRSIDSSISKYSRYENNSSYQYSPKKPQYNKLQASNVDSIKSIVNLNQRVYSCHNINSEDNHIPRHQSPYKNQYNKSPMTSESSHIQYNALPLKSQPNYFESKDDDSYRQILQKLHEKGAVTYINESHSSRQQSPIRLQSPMKIQDDKFTADTNLRSNIHNIDYQQMLNITHNIKQDSNQIRASSTKQFNHTLISPAMTSLSNQPYLKNLSYSYLYRQKVLNQPIIQQQDIPQKIRIFY